MYFEEAFERSTTKGRENVAFELELKKQNTKNKVMSPYLMIIGAMRNCGIWALVTVHIVTPANRFY